MYQCHQIDKCDREKCKFNRKCKNEIYEQSSETGGCKNKVRAFWQQDDVSYLARLISTSAKKVIVNACIKLQAEPGLIKPLTGRIVARGVGGGGDGGKHEEEDRKRHRNHLWWRH